VGGAAARGVSRERNREHDGIRNSLGPRNDDAAMLIMCVKSAKNAIADFVYPGSTNEMS
jgi:hypothetical protein